MRVGLLVAVSLMTVALAGCSDEPPSGTVDGSPTAVPAEGSASVETQEFQAGVDDPSDGGNPAYDPCPFDGQEPQDPDPFAQQRCQRPFTKINIHMMSLPDPQSASYSAFITGTDPEMKLGDLSLNETGGAAMYDLVYDNSDECSSATSNEGCIFTDTHDTIEIRLDDILVATTTLSGGAFEANEAFSGTSFSLDFKGKSGTLTLEGTSANLTYEAVFYEEAEDGSVSSFASTSVSAGENEVEIDRNFKDVAEVHIHVAGTKINVAQGSV